MCLTSASEDLWSEGWAILSSSDIVVYLGYVPSHLEAEPRARSGVQHSSENGPRPKNTERLLNMSLFAIAGNISGDLHDGHGATKGELPSSTATPVLYYRNLVKSVQRRLYHILCTKKKRLLRKSSAMPNQVPSLDMRAATSSQAIHVYQGFTCASWPPLASKGVARYRFASSWPN